MRIRILILLGLGMISPFVLGAHIDVRRDLEAQYNRWSKAYMANDVATLLDILSPDYTLTAADKEVTSFGAYKAYLQLKAKAPKDTTIYSTHIQKLTVKGNEAEVGSIEVMVTPKIDGNGHKSTSIHQHEYRDKWRLTSNTWRLYSTYTLKETTKIRKQ